MQKDMEKVYQRIKKSEYFLLFPLCKQHFRMQAKKIREDGQQEKKFEKQYSMSIDDVIDIFKDITKNQSRYDSIFQNRTLRNLQELHECYGMCITLYCYFTKEGFDLTQVPGKFGKEIQENCDWLKFGFHAMNFQYTYKNCSYDKAKEDYETMMQELVRICGGESSINQVVRLERFQGSKEAIEGMCDSSLLPIKGLLIADDERDSYYLTKNQCAACASVGRITVDNLLFLKTTKRIELIRKATDIKRDMFHGTHECILTHEWMLEDSRVKYYMEKLLLKALKNGYQSVFA